MLCMIFFGVDYSLIALPETNFDDLIWSYMVLYGHGDLCIKSLGVMGQTENHKPNVCKLYLDVFSPHQTW